MIRLNMKGFIFTCSDRTEKECFERNLFGMHSGYRDRVLQVKEGNTLFLLNTKKDRLMGIYQAASDGAKTWNRKLGMEASHGKLDLGFWKSGTRCLMRDRN